MSLCSYVLKKGCNYVFKDFVVSTFMINFESKSLEHAKTTIHLWT